tara:strand:- start:156 stop:293 length:138 start_codon:yes stop_codon:yes gene_type:complete
VNFFFFVFVCLVVRTFLSAPPQKTLKLKNLKKAKQKEGAKMMKTV